MQLHLDLVGGLAGDMFIAALLDAFPEHEGRVSSAIAAVQGEAVVPGEHVSCTLVPQGDGLLNGRRFQVSRVRTGPAFAPLSAESRGNPPHLHVTWASIRDRLQAARLPCGVRDVAIGLFQSLAEAEGFVHGVDADAVTFHEVGAWDSIADIVAIENGFAVGHQNYIAAAQRARNGLVGNRDSTYVASAGSSSDSAGAIAHLDALLDRKNDSVWTPAMQGAKINLLAAAQSLSDSLHEKQMEDYETDLTTALSSLSLAIGRPTETGVLGGIAGALASTSLGVPSGAAVVSGCRLPPSAPTYGLVDGNLTFVSVPREQSDLTVPTEIVVDRIAILPKQVVLYTRPQTELSHLCASAASPKSGASAVVPKSAARADSPESGGTATSMLPMAAHARVASEPTASFAGYTSAVVADDPAPAAGAASGPPSYTTKQAQAGAVVYGSVCSSCHGAKLQGVAGPAVAGKEFLASVASNKWTYADFRNLVVQQMPLNNPGSLTPKQYADVLAYLLAANCFPAGSTEFPTNDSPALAAVKFLAPTKPVTPTDTTRQTCSVAQ